MKVAFAAIALLLAANANAEVPVGTYSTVSESEWQVYVELKKGGNAEVRHEAWAAGGHANKETTRTKAKWSAAGDRITITYGGVVDVFEYTPALSLKELGLKGGASGLRQLEPIDKGSRVSGHSLWLEPHKFGEAE